jgi:hypothetical protein
LILPDIHKCIDLKISASHGGKRHVMVPGGQLMVKNDTSWESHTIGIGSQAALPCFQAGGQAVIRQKNIYSPEVEDKLRK